MEHPLKAYREERDLSQGDLARLVGRTGATISRWEAGERAPRIEDMIAIQKATDGAVSVALLADWWARRQNAASEPVE